MGTYWHTNDARLTGFIPHHPGAGRGISRIFSHIARGTTASPYVSLTRSFGVALDYAFGGLRTPTLATPAFVYEVEIDEQDGYGTRLVDPVVEVASQLGSPYDLRSYHHDGDTGFVASVAAPGGHASGLQQTVKFPPPGQGTPRSPLLHVELETLVRALRDAEILSFGAIAASQVKRRIDVH